MLDRRTRTPPAPSLIAIATKLEEPTVKGETGERQPDCAVRMNELASYFEDPERERR